MLMSLFNAVCYTLSVKRNLSLFQGDSHFRKSTLSKLKVLGKSVGLCKTSKRKDQLYISLLVSIWRIICENFNPNGLILAEI